MKKYGKTISEMLLDYSISVIKATRKVNKDYIGKHICLQLLRSATSVGANYEETRGPQSKRDFIHKLQVALKEARESSYWLKVLLGIDELKNSRDFIHLSEQSTSLINVLSKSVATAKKNMITS
ncbi:MAG: four helix bundle protein [Bacteroidetes bacterium]|nr:four helix bundle protein [Bacteroidota bacterium]